MNKNITFIGNHQGIDLGKLSGKTDIEYHSKIYMGDIYSIFTPVMYPEKIQSLLVSVGLADFVVLRVDNIDWKLGEQIIVCDLLEKDGVIFAEEWLWDQIKQVLKGTSLSDWEFVSGEKELWKILNEWVPRDKDKLEIWIDQAFRVKSVGTVVLGVLKGGKIKVHDKLKIFPANKEVEIRSIQIQDENKESACCNARVGLALKGVEPDDIPRGSIIGDVDLIDKINEWNKIPFYRGDENKITHVFHGIYFAPYQKGKLIKSIPKSNLFSRFLLVENSAKESLRIGGYGNF